MQIINFETGLKQRLRRLFRDRRFRLRRGGREEARPLPGARWLTAVPSALAEGCISGVSSASHSEDNAASALSSVGSASSRSVANPRAAASLTTFCAMLASMRRMDRWAARGAECVDTCADRIRTATACASKRACQVVWARARRCPSGPGARHRRATPTAWKSESAYGKSTMPSTTTEAGASPGLPDDDGIAQADVEIGRGLLSDKDTVARAE